MSNSWGVMAEHLGWGIIEEGWRKGPWTAEEDRLLIEYVKLHGEGRWNSVARLAGLKRNGKSCRLRWVNYLRPDLKRGQITPHEESIIIELHAKWGNRWSTIARSLPGRTDNEIKNYWRTHFKKRGNGSSNNSETAKARLLRRQQFQLQQQQQQQQQQLIQQNQMDVKKILSSLDDNENINRITNLTQGMSLSSAEEQGFLYSMFNGYASVPEACNEDNVLLDGLWNLDEGHGNLSAANGTSKASLQSLATPFY